MKPALSFACLAALAVTLAACGDEKAAQQGTAAGEILPASASDAMLPYDTVRSQPPLAPPPTESAKSSSRKSGNADESGDDDSEDSPEASPKPSPAIAPEPPAQ